MGQLQQIMTPLHKATKRDYLARMQDDKIHCMEVARKYGAEYWDGDRRYGYGGYRYMEGRWTPVAKALIEIYGLTSSSKVLDVGCGKGFLLFELTQLLPGIEVVGFDLAYAQTNSKEEIRDFVKVQRAQDSYPYEDDYFDLVISMTTLHNLVMKDLEKALKEIQRVGKSAYVMMESYRNSAELFNLECWALTAEVFFRPEEWEWMFDKVGYTGDFEYIYFE